MFDDVGRGNRVLSVSASQSVWFRATSGRPSARG